GEAKIIEAINATTLIAYEGEIAILGIITDITERKKMEEELRKRTYELGERLKELRCLYGISELVEKEGIFLEEILEGTLNLIPRSWQYPEITCARIVLEGQESKTNNFRETAWRQTSDIAVHGKKIGTVEVFYLEEKPKSDEGPFLKEERSLVDAIAKQLARIIERKQMENELKIKEEAIASSVNAITLADLRGNLTYVNRAFLHMWGYSDDKEVLGKPIARFLDTQGKAAELIEALRNKKNWMGELAAKRKDGSTFDVQLLASIVENEAGRAICIMASVIDITERKRIEQMKDDFVSLASHELRTPLTSIVGYVDLILGEDVGKINKEQKEFLQIISQNTQRLEALINDVLDIEKIESGRIKLKREKVNLIELVEASVNTFRVMAENKNLQLEKEIKAPELEVLGDSDRLSQVISNLLSNAIKYTKEGRVKVAAQAKGRFASVTVEDTGLGMKQEDLRNIFSRFFRSEDSYVKKTTGSGLGLSIAKATIERHNGDMKVESKLGVGSKFEVILPLLKK
ncbi:PAS domain S-box protein, partial [Candidatus Aerophobetes bacterium]